MNILISNDDGYEAPGIQCLRRHLSASHNTIVVAPRSDCSGYSSAITLKRPVQVEQTHDNHFIVEGTPVDCVHLGITALIESSVDMVVAGINAGRNIGDDVLYSGTVGAAFEGRHLGYPAIAVSLAGRDLTHYETAARIVEQVVSKIAASSPDVELPADSILNINVPDLPYQSLAGLRTTRLGRRRQAKAASPLTDHDTRGENSKNRSFWVGAAGDVEDTRSDSDFAAVEAGYVSITPLTSDLTHRSHSTVLADWVSSMDFG